MAADLASFQKLRPVAASSAIDDVIDAMAPAFELGFAYSFRDLLVEQGIELTIHHTSGWDRCTTATSATLGHAIAGLMGIRIVSAQASEGEASSQLDQLIEQADAAASGACPMKAFEPPAEPEEAPEPMNLMGEGMPDHELLPEQLEPLSDADKTTCLAMLKAMAADERKAFSVAFRDHFNVPREAKVLTPHITLQVHKAFIETFLNERELQEAAA